MSKKLIWCLAIAGGVYLLYRGISAKKTVALKEVLPAGVKLTGKLQTTTNGRAPNYPGETVGYGVRNWAEVIADDGSTDFVELA